MESDYRRPQDASQLQCERFRVTINSPIRCPNGKSRLRELAHFVASKGGQNEPQTLFTRTAVRKSERCSLRQDFLRGLKRKCMVDRFELDGASFSEFLRGDAHEHRQDPVRSAHGLPAMDYFHAIAIVDRYGGDHRRPDGFPAPSNRGSMAFAQLTYLPTESLRDIPASRSTHRHGLPPAGPALDAGRCQADQGATGVSMRRWPSGSTQARTLYVDASNWGWT